MEIFSIIGMVVVILLVIHGVFWALEKLGISDPSDYSKTGGFRG